LLTIVNDILDLATVDAGIMRLEIGVVNIRGALVPRPPNRSPIG
jgi:signal transduction histidine kinase